MFPPFELLKRQHILPFGKPLPKNSLYNIDEGNLFFAGAFLKKFLPLSIHYFHVNRFLFILPFLFKLIDS